MRRRLIPLVLVGTVVVITLAAGASIWVLSRQTARTTAVNEALSSARAFGMQRDGTFSLGTISLPKAASRADQELALKRDVRQLERLIAESARVDSARFFKVSGGQVDSSSLSNSEVPLSVLDSVAGSGSVGPSTAVAGSTGSHAWAAEAVTFRVTVRGPRRTGVLRSSDYVLTLTRTIGSTSFSSDFIVVALAVIFFAIVVSVALSRRITGPLRRAVSTTQRIAAGDLEARVGARPGDIPELSSLAGSIDAMAESLGRLRNAERQFLLSVSHELRTPLTSIRGYSEAILDGTAADPTQAAGVIGNEARRLERLVGDLLDLAKLDARTFSFHFRTVNVAEVVEEVAEELRPVVDSAGLALVVRPGPPVLARVDPDRLDQVLANLVENAAKYARTTIVLGGDAAAGFTRLIVEDDGPGIPPQEIGRIFERHYSADRHARPGRPRGSGLGLAIAAELSGAMGATVRAESPVTPAGGTRMVVTLPILQPSQNPHISHTAP